ncbi:O-antigen polymerase [Piscibacillus sp. B03]|uniref:O-antigen polymerase n=1 Tax=Piscibacillus sp. B03 TaxID=3457430 RepID=UPI003FCDD715
MVFLLLIALIMMLFMAFILTGRDILSPWVVSICMFILSVSVAALNYNYWMEDISAVTVLIILIALLSFGVGELFTKTVILKRGRNNSTINQVKLINGNKGISIANRWIVLIILFLLVVTYFHFKFKQSIAMAAGYSGGLDTLLFYARHAQFNPDINSDASMLLSLGLTFSRVLTYFFIFVFLYNMVFFRFRITSLKYLFPAILNIGNILLTTGRTEFINLITVCLILFFIMLKQKHNWISKVNTRIIIYGIIGVALFLIIFRLSGFLTGKSERLTLWENFSLYIGASIVALDKYISNPPSQIFFGKETFYALYHIFRKFGFDIPYYQVPLEFVSWKNVDVNIYTALRRYIQDFSVVGMVFIQFLLGSFYGAFYQYIKKKNRVSLELII